MATAGYGNHESPQLAERRAPSPDPTAVGPDSSAEKPDASNPSNDDRRQAATPGDGAGPSGPQGAEVDPGTG